MAWLFYSLPGNGCNCFGVTRTELKGVFSLLLYATATGCPRYRLAGMLFFFQFYGWCIFFFTGKITCIFVFRKMHLKSRKKPSQHGSTLSQEGAHTFKKWGKVSGRVRINPRFMVLTAGDTVIPIVLWGITQYAYGITSRRTTVLNIGTLVYLATVTSLFPSVHLNAACNEQCVCWM